MPTNLKDRAFQRVESHQGRWFQEELQEVLSGERPSDRMFKNWLGVPQKIKQKKNKKKTKNQKCFYLWSTLIQQQ